MIVRYVTQWIIGEREKKFISTQIDKIMNPSKSKPSHHITNIFDNFANYYD